MTAESPMFTAFLRSMDEETQYRCRERVAIMCTEGTATRPQAEAWVVDHWRDEFPYGLPDNDTRPVPKGDARNPQRTD